MIIRTKEDFKGKYIKLPKNLSERKFDKIKVKFEKLGVKNYLLSFSSIEDNCIFIKFLYDGTKIYCVSNTTYKDNEKEISIKEFLKEEETIDYYLPNTGDEKYNVIQLENYNCIPNNYMVFYGTDLREIKEDVDRAIQGFSYKKPNMMKMKNAIKKGLKFKRKKEIIYSAFNQQVHKLSNHSVGGLGYPTIIPIEEYEIAELVINSDEMVEIIEKQ